jgi:ankyrin repeat protein
MCENDDKIYAIFLISKYCLYSLLKMSVNFSQIMGNNNSRLFETANSVNFNNLSSFGNMDNFGQYSGVYPRTVPDFSLFPVKNLFDLNFSNKKIFGNVESNFLNEIVSRSYENSQLVQINNLLVSKTQGSLLYLILNGGQSNNFNTEEILKLLADPSTDLNVKDSNDKNILVILCSKNNTDVLDKILDDYFDRIDKDVITSFLLHLFTTDIITNTENKVKYVKNTLDKMNKEFVNTRDKMGNTFLIHSVSNISLLKLLLEYDNIEINACNDLGMSAIMCAIKDHQYVSLTELLKYINSKLEPNEIRTVINHKNNFGDSPLLMAVKLANQHAFDLLLRTPYIDVNTYDLGGNTSLMIAIDAKNKYFIEKIINCATVDVNLCNKFGKSPIMKAVETENMENIVDLLNKNVNINSVDSLGRSVFFNIVALKYKNDSGAHKQYINFYPCDGFMECREIVDTDNYFKKSSVYDMIIVKMLNSGKINVNTSDIFGNTPFSLICRNSDVYLFDKLCEYSSFDPNFKNSKKLSSFDIIEKMLTDIKSLIKYEDPCVDFSDNPTEQNDELDELEGDNTEQSSVVSDVLSRGMIEKNCLLSPTMSDLFATGISFFEPTLNEINKFELITYFYNKLQSLIKKSDLSKE